MLQSTILKINSKFKSADRIAFVIMLTSTMIFVAIGFNIIFGLINEKDIVWRSFPMEEEKLILFFAGVLFAPLFETWFNQYLPYYFLNKIKFLRDRSYMILLVSALFFGMLHFYSLFYIFFGFFMGIVLMYGYMIRVKTDSKTFILIAICHSIFNFVGFIISFF